MDLELYTYQNDNCDVPNDNKPFPDWVDEYNNLQRENLLPICKLLISSEECSNNVVENEFRVDILLYWCCKLFKLCDISVINMSKANYNWSRSTKHIS